MKKYIFIDIDGTLRDSKGFISKKNKEAIKKITEKGFEVILASGRPINKTKLVQEECQTSPWLIASNGAQLYNSLTDEITYQSSLSIPQIDKIMEIASNLQIAVIFNVGTDRYGNVHHESDFFLTEEIYSKMKKQMVSQAVLYSSFFEKIMKAKEILIKENISIVNESRNLTLGEDHGYNKWSFIDVSTINTNKGTAIKEFLKLSPGKVYAIGDSVNDLDMLEIADISIAIGNSLESLKNSADFITKTNDEDGVGYAIDWILSNEK